MQVIQYELPVEVPDICKPIFEKHARYKVLHGGRGSAKSNTLARYLIYLASGGSYRILCTREMQNSIKDSVHRLLSDTIYELRCDDLFEIQKDVIRSVTGSEFIFKGLHQHVSEIKSLEGIDIVWCEEAERISEDSWTVLIPTIRKPNSEILVSFNPEDENSSTYKRFVKNPPDDSIVIQLNYDYNPWFEFTALKGEMEYDKRVDFEKYEHIWMGKPKRYAASLIFRGKLRVDSFESPGPEDPMQLYFGSDFGYSNDPCVLVRMFIKDRKLHIDHEAYAVGIEINELERFFDTVPGSRKWKIVADSERPDTISFLSQKGFNIVGAEKGKGSVEDGIQFIRGFEEIIIHPRCRGAVDNFSNYKWKTDRITNEVLPIPAEGSDHVPDAVRYALESYIKRKTTIFDIWK